MGQVFRFVCSRCGREFPPDSLTGRCACGGPLLADYDLASIAREWKKESLKGAAASMWRYAPVLPADADAAVTLGEGWTPLIRAVHLGGRMGALDLWLKDEGQNPTDSFKARGLCCAVTMAKKFGVRKLATASAGNAGGALSAYAAAAGIEAYVFMPSDVPQANFLESKSFGAKVTLVDGLIGDCARIVSERAASEKWFDVSTFKEPYRLEGKKTMGYELAEQFEWQVPDTILYPCGGGVGLIAIWRALRELEQLGWIGAKRPKMIAVQAEGCQPITKAFEENAGECEAWPAAHTVASGLRVPKALADFLILQILRESKGLAISISDTEMIDFGLQLASTEGILPAPEGGACVAAVAKLIQSGFLSPGERILILNTGSGLKYLDVYATRFSRRAATEQDKLGGLVTPR
jgi:threonine synthase